MKTLHVDMCVAHFALWLGTKPATERYNYDSTSKCATAQYFWAHGFTNVHALDTSTSGFRRDHVFVIMMIPFAVRMALMNSAVGGYVRWGDANRAMQRVLAQM